MITNQELSSINLSATKKDFYQIWNELLDTAKKLSERWDPTSTNESDPGIVLLKVLTAVADTLNYNIDKNILEAFMPSAAQEESMRKLTEMLGYNMKYYQSAMTQVKLTYIGDAAIGDNGLIIPKFMVITNVDKDINYLVTDYGRLITNDNRSVTLNCIEGQLVECESENDNIISINQLDDNFRYYLPETQIAENGIFIYTVSDGSVNSIEWEKVSNLNTRSPGKEVWKFGYDSKEARPYIQFPEDVAQIMGDGLLISYVRTSGVNGNISAKTLSTFEVPSYDEWADFDESMFVVSNPAAAKNGANIETMEAAYNGFKKTIGTFDTLITCRDYMNKIYQLSDSLNNPLVSNIIVSDIRDDINKAVTLCTMDDYGIRYVDKALKKDDNDLISHFDLILYPFKTIKGLNTYDEYINSFKYDASNNSEIIAKLEDHKTISHVFNAPSTDDIVCIKNYLKLNAKIITVDKVNTAEELLILANIKEALYSAFNMRQLDFGEEIPQDSIRSVIENADARIKTVLWGEPATYTAFCTTENEYVLDKKYETGNYEGNKLYNQLALRNILAGRVALLDYNDSFAYSLLEKPSSSSESSIFPDDDTIKTISKLTSEFSVALNNGELSDNAPLKLTANEVIKFRYPNLKTTLTYPAYINYYLHLESSEEIPSGAEYQLKNNDYLLINYTKSDQATEQTSIVNKCYKSGTIIKASGISLKDSKKYNESDNGRHPWTKTSGYDFAEYGIASIPGMLTFGPSEQLEIREFVQVKLDESITNLYWKFNSSSTKIAVNESYTLKDGEYIFYTDINKTVLAYYGSGTEIINGSNYEIKASATNDSLDVATIFENGIEAIPWIQFNLTDTSCITLKEYQYKNMTSGDTLNSLKLAESAKELNRSWEQCSAATWTYSDGTNDSISDNSIEGAYWEARTLLEFNMGPSTPQTLNNKDSIIITYSNDDTDTLTNTAAKSNTMIQAATDTYYAPANCNLKLFCLEAMPVPANVTLNNMNGYWTSLNNSNIPEDGLELGVIVPKNSFDMLTIYVADNEADAANKKSSVYINCNGIIPSIYCNYSKDSKTWAWWDDSTEAAEDAPTNYYLHAGINVIRFDADDNNGGTFTIKMSSASNTAVIVMGQLGVIKTTSNSCGINLNTIDYKPETDESNDEALASALLTKIIDTDTDKEFYYNCPLDNSFALDLNADNEEKLSSTETWYNYNNVNNKFVISEIDADWLDYGITIAKSSKARQ